MADNRQVLIHLHTGDVKVPTSELIELGEIAVQHNDSEAALYVKKTSGEISKFIDSSAVDSKVNAAIATEKTRAEGAEEALSERIDSLSGSSHSHDNKTVLDDITADKVSAWDAAEQNAKDYADGLADNYDAVGAAASALTEAKEYADGLAGNYEVAGAAASALTEAKEYADTKISNLKLDETYASKVVVDTLVGEDSGKTVRSIAVEEVAKVVANADADFDTLKEIADWIQNDTTGAAKMANDIKELQNVNADSRLDALEAISGESHTHSNKALLDTYTQTEADLADAVAKKHEHTNKAVLDGVTADKVSAWDAAEQNAKDYADGLAGNYDAVGAAASALTEAKEYADGLAGNYEVAGAAAQALADAKADAEAKYQVKGDYEAAGAAASALTEAKAYTDTKISTLRIDCGTF